MCISFPIKRLLKCSNSHSARWSLLFFYYTLKPVSAFNFCLMLWHSHQSLTLKYWFFNDRFWSFWWCTLKLSVLPLSKDVSSTVFSHLTLRKKFLFLKSLINSWYFRKSLSLLVSEFSNTHLNSFPGSLIWSSRRSSNRR